MRIYKGDYDWYFKKDKIVTEQQLKSELKITSDNFELNYMKNNEIITQINADATGVQIKAEKVSISGVLSAYRGLIGGFSFGEHPSGWGRWITGTNNFQVGMSDGRNRSTALWVNWGNRWDKAGDYAWYVGSDGQMTCKNRATFSRGFDCWGIIDVHGNDVIGDAGGGQKTKVVWWSQKDRFLSSSSDRKLKTNIKNTEVSAIDIINRLEFKQYNWIKDSKFEKLGLIAQDVELIDKSKVVTLNDNTKAIKYFELIPYLLKASQELNEENIKLRKELESTTRESINQRKEIIQLKQEIQNIKNLIKGDK